MQHEFVNLPIRIYVRTTDLEAVNGQTAIAKTVGGGL